MTIYSIEDLPTNLLQDINDKLYGERWEGEYDPLSMIEEIERLQSAAYQLSQTQEKIGSMRAFFKEVMLEEFAA